MLVQEYIAYLLYTHKRVIIPGLGCLDSQFQPATVDVVQGQINPPRKSLLFNENITTNDGILVQNIAEKTKTSSVETARMVADFVADCRQKLALGETIHLPNVGNLFLDIEKNIRFVPENTNFLTDAFGLEPIQYYPIFRIQEQASSIATSIEKQQPTVHKSTISQANNSLPDWVRFAIPIAAVLILIPLSFYVLQENYTPPNPSLKKNISDIRLNEKPKPLDQTEEELAQDVNDDVETSDDDFTDEPAPQKAISDTPTVTKASPNGVVVIGIFSHQESVNVILKQIFKEGYEPHLEKLANGKTRVGIQYDPSLETEAEILDYARRRFDRSAYIAH